MATVFTHAALGAALAAWAPRELPRRRIILVMVLLPVLPDLDVIGFNMGIAYGDMLGHRGFTHSLPFAALMALICTPWLTSGQPAKIRAVVFALCFLATASHGLLDAITDAGLGVGFFIPFDDTRYFLPWRPIATSPLSISAFFSGPGLSILTSEFLWLGVPILCVGAAGLWYRRRQALSAAAQSRNL